MRALITQFARFGVVGLGGLIVDVAVFNLLRVTVLSPDLIYEGPIIAKVISTSLAIIVNWLGNRYWTFGSRRRPHMLREGLEFALVSVGGMLIGLTCLWVSHYVLGFTSLLADNIATNVVGLALGTAFRFTFYRLWVFREVKLPIDTGKTTEVSSSYAQ
ncbi:MAG: GtrA family protein [Cryobacterium sp.]|nr:GtrA family protein [Cryobacterium sp.]